MSNISLEFANSTTLELSGTNIWESRLRTFKSLVYSSIGDGPSIEYTLLPSRTVRIQYKPGAVTIHINRQFTKLT